MNAVRQPLQPQHQHFAHASSSAVPQRRHPSKHQFIAEFSQCLFDFVIQLLPTAEEMAVKEDVRKLLERLIRTIEPDSRLLSFGSTANGFALRNSDMDLCCLIDSEERLSATDLVTMLGDLLERETKFHVKPLPHARIPIVKLSLDPSPGLPLGIACDIGFENRLALENTRLLMSYAMVDPTRVRTMVLFLKVWSKRRKINSPYKGTLSSYGYVLLVIYFLVHVKNPPVLPNLQQMPPLHPISEEDTHLGGYDIWFFDDIELLRQRWQSSNTESVAELLIDFFRYYSRDFSYNTGVASIRAGLLKKESKGWLSEPDGRFDARERNRLCIEDPFETDFNVARCVTKDGLYTIRGEFMRASRIIASRPERAIIALAQLCEERKDELLLARPSVHPQSASTSTPPRLSSVPPQAPYTVGSSPARPDADRLSPPQRFFEPGPRLAVVQQVPTRSPPEHMAPKRAKWTSPPPPEAPPAEHTSFEDRLDQGLSLATASTEARDLEHSYTSSSSNSEALTDDEREMEQPSPDPGGFSDDDRSVRSLTEASTSFYPPPLRPRVHVLPESVISRLSPLSRDSNATPKFTGSRGRLSSRLGSDDDIPTFFRQPTSYASPSSFPVSSRRTYSGTMRSLSASASPVSPNPPISFPTIAYFTPLPPSPTPNTQSQHSSPTTASQTTVYYETVPPQDYSPRMMTYVSPRSLPFVPSYSPYQEHHLHPPESFVLPTSSSHSSPASTRPPSRTNTRRSISKGHPQLSAAGSLSSLFPAQLQPRPSHSHTFSSATIIAPEPASSSTHNVIHNPLSPSLPVSSSPSAAQQLQAQARAHALHLSSHPESSSLDTRTTSPVASTISTHSGSFSPTPSSSASSRSHSASPSTTSLSSPTHVAPDMHGHSPLASDQKAKQSHDKQIEDGPSPAMADHGSNRNSIVEVMSNVAIT